MLFVVFTLSGSMLLRGGEDCSGTREGETMLVGLRKSHGAQSRNLCSCFFHYSVFGSSLFIYLEELSCQKKASDHPLPA